MLVFQVVIEVANCDLRRGVPGGRRVLPAAPAGPVLFGSGLVQLSRNARDLVEIRVFQWRQDCADFSPQSLL